MNIEINDELWSRVVQSAEKLQYGSPQHFIEQAIEREVGAGQATGFDADVVRKMEELGYLDYGLDI
jgi:hypothetical protein